MQFTVKKVFLKFYDKYQKILQKNQLYLMIQKNQISNKLDKKQQIIH